MMELSLNVTDPGYSEAQAPDPDSYPALQGGQAHGLRTHHRLTGSAVSSLPSLRVKTTHRGTFGRQIC